MNPDSDAIIERLKKGDPSALRTLYESYFYRVVNFSYKLLHNQDDAREVAQDVFIKIWDIREGLDEHKSVSGLIFRITKFKSIDLLRREKRRLDTKSLEFSNEFVIHNNSVDDEIFKNELEEEYRKVVANLPEKRRQVFQMSRDENLTYCEIAEKLNISPKTVEAQIRLALQQIKKELSDRKIDLLILLATLSIFQSF